jgi:hypothetical protein
MPFNDHELKVVLLPKLKTEIMISKLKPLLNIVTTF